MMSSLTIGYEFMINVAVKKRNGKTYKSHSAMGLGTSYYFALYDVCLKLKKKRSEILKVNSARVCRIAFAVENGKSVYLKLSEHQPEIPQDLNADLKYLPKY